MIGRWLTVSQTITRIYNATGHVLTADDVVKRGRGVGLVVESTHEHDRVLEQSVADYEARYARRPIPRDPDNPAEREMTHSDDYDHARERET